GAPGDVVILDPGVRWKFDPQASFSKSRNTPFAGETLVGRADLTIVRGKVVYRREG
ncbi:MAG: dihydroorotase, partial [Gemmatimonadetes bacterium]